MFELSDKKRNQTKTQKTKISSVVYTFVRSGLGSSCTLIMYARVKSTKANVPRLITNRTMGGLFLKKLFKFSQIAQSNAMAVMFFSPWKSKKVML